MLENDDVIHYCKKCYYTWSHVVQYLNESMDNPSELLHNLFINFKVAEHSFGGGQW